MEDEIRMHDSNDSNSLNCSSNSSIYFIFNFLIKYIFGISKIF